jgi:Glutathione peroxidase
MNIYDFKAKRADGSEISLADYKGKVLLIVNTASKCGFTPQFEGLEALYQKYKEQGLMIFGFPCNQFNEQDPGTNDEIQEFCKINFGVTFPVLAKIDVNGPDADPIFDYLKSQKSFAGFDPLHELSAKLHEILSQIDPDYEKKSDIKWNFTKFVIDRDGKVVGRYEPTTTPEKLDDVVAKLL